MKLNFWKCEISPLCSSIAEYLGNKPGAIPAIVRYIGKRVVCLGFQAARADRKRDRNIIPFIIEDNKKGFYYSGLF